MQHAIIFYSICISNYWHQIIDKSFNCLIVKNRQSQSIFMIIFLKPFSFKLSFQLIFKVCCKFQHKCSCMYHLFIIIIITTATTTIIIIIISFVVIYIYTVYIFINISMYSKGIIDIAPLFMCNSAKLWWQLLAPQGLSLPQAFQGLNKEC